MSQPDTPYPAFAFQVDFSDPANGDAPICQGGFSECSGLEATMEPKVIRGGGQNYGAAQRAGQVTFGTVILRRGMTGNRDLWAWFSHVNQAGRTALRLQVTITVLAPGAGSPVLRVRLDRALPVKLKCADLNARATEVAVEELHLVHEGLSIE